jgi:MaoC like domain
MRTTEVSWQSPSPPWSFKVTEVDEGSGRHRHLSTRSHRSSPRTESRHFEYPRAALIYRLNGDMNPLHVDPDAARLAGFDRPVLHGLCTSGMACRAILSAYCAHNPEMLRAMSVRFIKPVYPGENLQLEFYERPERIEFGARVVERYAVVLDGCSAVLDTSKRV